MSHIKRDYYTTGQIANEITYINNVMNGVRKLWSFNGRILNHAYAINNELEGEQIIKRSPHEKRN